MPCHAFVLRLRRAVVCALSSLSMATFFQGSQGNHPWVSCRAHATHDTSLLLAYPPASDHSASLVRALLRPFSLENFANKYFEKEPLVIRGRSPDYYERLMDFRISNVDTIIENGFSHAGEQGQMIFGSDWNIIKRVFIQADGEFWTAALPPKETRETSGISAIEGEGGGEGGGEGDISLAEARAAFQRGGFSILINRLQRRWRGVAEIALALEDVLGHPVNANLYMTPPGSQAFEAHFDWMDGIVVQLTGSKRWILYDEMIAAPRPDLKYKPTAADLGEPVAVLELRPGDLMYIPRGWPHEAAVNSTATLEGGVGGGPSLHVTFGVESALSGTYESLVHHALEVAAAEHPLLFGVPAAGEDETDSDRGRPHYSYPKGAERGPTGMPWLELLHVWIHDVASRDERLRRAVPLAPLFSASRAGRSGSEEAVHPPIVSREFQEALEACVPRGGGADASSALKRLDSLLRSGGDLQRVRDMYELKSEDGEWWFDEQSEATNGSDTDDEKEECSARSSLARARRQGEWSREMLTAFDRGSFSSSMRERFKGFQEVASVERALRRMVSVATARARERVATTERDLARCGQSRRVN